MITLKAVTEFPSFGNITNKELLSQVEQEFPNVKGNLRLVIQRFEEYILREEERIDRKSELVEAVVAAPIPCPKCGSLLDITIQDIPKGEDE